MRQQIEQMALSSHRGLTYKWKMKVVVRLKVTKISQSTRKQFRIYKLGKYLHTGKLKLMFRMTSPVETLALAQGSQTKATVIHYGCRKRFIDTDGLDARQSSLAEWHCFLPSPTRRQQHRILRLGAQLHLPTGDTTNLPEGGVA